MERVSISAYLEDFVRHGSQCAYVQRRGYRTERWAYGEVAETIYKFARELEGRGVSRGDRVLIWGENCAEWVIAFFACVLRGAIAVPMDNTATAEFTNRVRADVEAKLVVCSREHATSITGAAVVLLEELREHVAQRSGERHEGVTVAPAEPIEIVFTSGTTAEPKGVVISHSNVLGNVAPLETEIRRYLKYERFVHPVRFLNLLPLSHVFGQFLGIFLPQLMGGTVIFQDALKPAEVIGTIRCERISILVAVPRMLQSLKEKIERDLEDQGKLQEFRHRFQTAENKHFLHRWWIFRR